MLLEDQDRLLPLLLDALKDARKLVEMKLPPSTVAALLGGGDYNKATDKTTSRRATTILTNGKNLRPGEYAVLYYHMTNTYGPVIDKLPDGKVKAFLLAAKASEEGRRAQEAETDIASTVFGRQLRNKSLAGKPEDFEDISKCFFLVHWGTERKAAAEVVSCAQVFYNERANVCEMIVAVDDVHRIHALGTYSGGTYGFFGFQENTTRLFAMNIRRSSPKSFSGVLLSEERETKFACKVLLIEAEMDLETATRHVTKKTYRELPEFKEFSSDLYRDSIDNSCRADEYLESYISRRVWVAPQTAP